MLFTKYNVCFYQNFVLRKVSTKNNGLITPDNLVTLFSKLKKIETLGPRACLGEDALSQTAFRKKTIYCDFDIDISESVGDLDTSLYATDSNESLHTNISTNDEDEDNMN